MDVQNIAAASSELSQEQKLENELKEAHQRIRQLREKLVTRCKDLGRWKPFIPSSVEVPREPAKAEAEKTAFNIITGCLFDPTTLIPIDVQAMHRKILVDPAGERYEAALAALGLSTPEPLVNKLASISFKFGPAEYTCLRVCQLAYADGARMYVTRVDRPALTRLTGIEDPEKHKQQHQQQQAGGQQGTQQQQMGGPGGQNTAVSAAGGGLQSGMMPGGGQPQPPPGQPPGQAAGGGMGRMGMMGGPGGVGVGGLMSDGMGGAGMGGVGGGAAGGMMGQGGGPGGGGFGMGMGMMGQSGFMGVGRPPLSGGALGFPGAGVPPPMPPMLAPPEGLMPPPPPPPGQPPEAKRMRMELGQGGGGSRQQQGGQGQGGGGGGGSELMLDDLLNKRSVKEKNKVEKGSELLDILAKPTARESARVEQFRTAGGSAIREHCPHLTKEECRRVNGAPVACARLHFFRVVQPHTDVALGNCSYLDTCRNMRTCKYVHYRPDPEPDVPGMGAEIARLRANVPKYLQALQAPQWINCDVRTFDMSVLGKFGVIMADPPWEIHQDLPYGTMKDDEMLNLNIGCLQDNGVIFVWVTGRAMELARECLAKWGYKRMDELIWVKTNQLQRLIRTGRTGHWLNHSKEHCLVGIKGNPQLNRFVDCDVVVGEVRETSRKPDEMYPLLERLSPGTRKLEIFARAHNLKPGWVGLGNQLDTVNVIDPDLRQRFAARYGFEPDPTQKCTVK